MKKIIDGMGVCFGASAYLTTATLIDVAGFALTEIALKDPKVRLATRIIIALGGAGVGMANYQSVKKVFDEMSN